MTIIIHTGDCLGVLHDMPDASVHCCVTSPPYFGLRNYGHDGQIGLEPTPDAYVAKLVDVFREVRRVLRDDGACYVNIGDSYNAAGRIGHGTRIGFKQGTNRASAEGSDNTRPSVDSLKPKDLIGIPWRIAFALQADGWYLRQDIIWSKPNPMPESVRDRCTKAHEYVFLLSKSARYWFDADAIRETPTGRTDPIRSFGACSDRDDNGRSFALDGSKGANRRSVWTIASQPFSDAHFATMPPKLAELCIKAGCPEGGTVLDPFAGAGTTGLVADRLQRDAVLIELNPAYADMARARIHGDCPLFAEAEGLTYDHE